MDDSTVIVTVDVSAGKGFDILTPIAAQADGAPTLVDDVPQRHQCVGWVYREPNQIWIRYTPEDPIIDKGQLPVLTRSRTDQELTLIFRCSLKVRLKYFAIGDIATKELAPVVKLDTPQTSDRRAFGGTGDWIRRPGRSIMLARWGLRVADPAAAGS